MKGLQLTGVLTAILLATSTSLCAAETSTEEMSFDVSSTVRISLENINGEIIIEGMNTDQVELVAEKKAKSLKYLEEMEIKVDATEDHISIETRHPKNSGGWFGSNDGGGSVNYRLTVPYDAVLNTVSSVNGDIEISNVTGLVKSETVNGTIAANGLESDAELETVNGSIEAYFNILQGDQRVNAEAVNGRVTLHLPAESSVKISAETVNGSIDASDFGLKADKGFVGRDLNGVIGSGEARVSVDTVNGSVKLRKRKD